MKTLHLLFSHTLTPDQQADAKASLSVEHFNYLPETLQQLWSGVPSEIDQLSAYLQPLMDWLAGEVQADDLVLVQGDFGASYLMVEYCMAQKLVPIYATTARVSVEEAQADGSIVTKRVFKHQRFRKYGQ